jgi:type I restriction-modification system DNA methylase subunit
MFCFKGINTLYYDLSLYVHRKIMSSLYTCDLCKKTFKQKVDFTRHKNKKAPCISLQEIEKTIQKKEEASDAKMQLINIFKCCLNILRDNEGLTGEKALRNLSYFLVLRLIEPRIGKEIDLENYEYDFSDYEFSDDEALVKSYRTRLLSIAKFSALLSETEDNVPGLLKYLWDIILSEHPSTKNIFLKEKTFDIRRQTTFKKLIEKLMELPNTEYDILGNAYEEVIKDIMTGKVLGQFFTPPIIKKMMIELISPKLFEDGKFESCGDPTMGTGGFLITYLKYLLENASVRNIKLDWEYAKTEGIYGKELEPDTYQLAVSNMLISSGHMFENLDRGDSIRDPIIRKFDCILSNPPFGIKGLVFDDYNNPLKEEYTPIKTDKAVCLFIQAIIYMLKIGGRCAIVLPDGQELFSKSNKALVAVREYLLKTCDLKQVICLPSGIFTYTSIKTCVFYFIKKKERKDALEVVLKESKATGKITSREYKFSKTLQTSTVKFYDFNPYENVKNLLAEVDISKIAANGYSLNYAEYREEEKKEEYSKEIEIKTLGEIFQFETGKIKAMNCDESGIYPVISSSNIHTHSSFVLDGENIFILKIFDGSADKSYTTKIKYFNGKCNFTSLLYHMKPNDDNILNIKYLYYYLNNDVDSISKKYQKGLCNKTLNLDLFLNYKFPLPCIQLQTKLVEQLDFIYEKAIPASLQKIETLRKMNEIILESFGKGVEKTLGEICDIDYGTRITKSKNTEGEYSVYGSGKATFTSNLYNRDEFNVLIGRFALSEECVRLTNFKLFLNDSGLTVKPKVDFLLHKYIGYFLYLNQKIVYDCARGTAQKNLEMDKFNSIQIPIPPLSVQSRIVEKCEKNDVFIASLEKEIEELKSTAKEILDSILNVPSMEDHPFSSSSYGESSEIIISEKRRGKKKA